MEELISKARKPLMSPKEHSNLSGKGGFDFSGGLPHVWWQHSHFGLKCVRVDLLCWSTDPTCVGPKVSEDGNCPLVHGKMPSNFLGINRAVGCHWATGVAAFAAGIAHHDIANTMHQVGNAIFQAIKDVMDGQNIKPVVVPKLPFKCLWVFVDPHIQNGGHCIHNCNHEWQPGAHIAAVAAAVAPGNPPSMAPCRFVSSM